MRATISFIIFCLMLWPLNGHTTIRTPANQGYYVVRAFCSDIDDKKPISLHFCAKEIKHRTPNIIYVMYIEVSGPKHITLDNSKITIVHLESGKELPYTIDDSLMAVTDGEPSETKHLSIFFIYLPEILVKIMREDVEVGVYITLGGKKHQFKLTKEEHNEFRMIAGVE